MTEKINVSSLKNAKFENMTAEQVIKKYEEVLNSRERQIYELSAEIGQITKKTQKMKAKYENCKEQNPNDIKIKNQIERTKNDNNEKKEKEQKNIYDFKNQIKNENNSHFMTIYSKRDLDNKKEIK